MVVLNGNRLQYCPDQSHDGAWSVGHKSPATRNIWPLQWFQKAVVEYNEGNPKAAVEPSALPELDITLEV